MTPEVIAQPEQPVATTAPALPAEIQAAFEKTEAAKSELDRIRELIKRAQSDRADADREFQASFAALAEAEASAALGGPAPDSGLRKQAEARQKSLLTHDARIAGLQARERAAAEILASTAQELAHVGDRWNASEKQAARAVYEAALERFIADVTEPIGIGLALNDSRLGLIARGTQLFAFDDTGRNAWDCVRYYRQNNAIMFTWTEYARVLQIVRNAVNSARQLSAPPPVDGPAKNSAIE